MRTTVLILIGILILVKLFHRKSKKSVSASDDDWKPNKNARGRTWDSAGNETNPRHDLMCWDKKIGKTIKVHKPFKD
jgi:hypothetical protein